MMRHVSARRLLQAGVIALLTGGAASVAAPPLAAAQSGASQGAVAQQIANHFASVRTMKGEFVQFGPRGDQTGGTFAIARPGKVRFDYEPPAQFSVVADGSNLQMNNEKMKTYDVVPLSQTPLQLLLNDRIDLSGGRLKQVKQEQDLTTIVMGDQSLFGNATITMMFDPNTFALRQWTVTDAQGKDTTVMLFNVQEDVAINSSQFEVDYSKARRGSRFDRN